MAAATTEVKRTRLVLDKIILLHPLVKQINNYSHPEINSAIQLYRLRERKITPNL